jgi:ABC-type phosphate transport system substrate-binding protein
MTTKCLVLLLAVVGTAHGDVHLNGAVARDVSEFFEAELGFYKQEHPSFNISYEYIISGPAISLLSANSATSASSVNFAITQNIAPSSSACTTNGLLPIPLMAGVAGVFYNVPGLVDAKLDACTLANIFAGSITTWADPAIQTLNPDAKYASLPTRRTAVFPVSVCTGLGAAIRTLLTSLRWPSFRPFAMLLLLRLWRRHASCTHVRLYHATHVRIPWLYLAWL